VRLKIALDAGLAVDIPQRVDGRLWAAGMKLPLGQGIPHRLIAGVPRRLGPWWRADAAGAIVLTVCYSFKIIEFEKGKAGVAVPSKERLVSIINTMITKSGELLPCLRILIA